MFKSLAPRTTDDFWPHAGRSRGDVDSQQGGPGIGHRLATGIRFGMAAIRKQRTLLRGLLELKALDDRMLEDIGVSRNEIGYVVRYGRVT
jgi:uncharacterized protein YjiS (DUF1127 family)